MGWWKYSISITMWLYSLCPSLGQDVRTTTHPSATYCEGVVFPLPIDFSSTRTVYGDCGRSIIYNHDTSSEIVVEQEGVDLDQKWVSRTVTPTYYSSDPILFISYKFKAKKSGKVTIITKFRKVQAAIEGYCEADDYTLEQRDIFPIEVIPTPSKPELNVDRAISPHVIHFKASGCPTSKDEVDYKWNEKYCLKDENNIFKIENKDGTLLGGTGIYYRVACSERGCMGEASEFKFGLAYTPPDVDQIPINPRGDVNIIENIRASNRGDYHNYSVETEICDIGQNGCSVTNVFQTMISSNRFVAPSPADFNVGGWGSEYYGGDMDGPVKSYNLVNLSGPLIEFYMDSDYDLSKNIAKKIPNTVLTYIDYPRYAVINYTMMGHALFPGRVMRQVIQKCNKVYIVTIGEGQSMWYEFSDNAGIYIKNKNVTEGKRMFPIVDQRLKNEFNNRYP